MLNCLGRFGWTVKRTMLSSYSTWSGVTTLTTSSLIHSWILILEGHFWMGFWQWRRLIKRLLKSLETMICIGKASDIWAENRLDWVRRSQLQIINQFKPRKVILKTHQPKSKLVVKLLKGLEAMLRSRQHWTNFNKTLSLVNIRSAL